MKLNTLKLEELMKLNTLRLEDLMKRYKYNAVLIIILSLATCYFYNYRYSSPLHEKVHINTVESIIIWTDSNRTTVSNQEIHAIIDCFNSTTNTRRNKHFNGTTPNSGILIQLKNGQSIHILNSGTDFEVQRWHSSGKFISYWGEQKEISELLSSI